jgi:hypothetical protein
MFEPCVCEAARLDCSLRVQRLIMKVFAIEPCSLLSLLLTFRSTSDHWRNPPRSPLNAIKVQIFSGYEKVNRGSWFIIVDLSCLIFLNVILNFKCKKTL